MSYSEANSELFDRFLSGKMSQEEQTAFEKRLAVDNELAAAFRLHKLLAEGIRDHARTELKSYIKEKGEIQYWGGNIWPKSMRYAAVAVFVLFAGLYLIVRNYTTPVLEKEIAVQTDKTEPKTTNSDTGISPSEEIATQIEAPASIPQIESDKLAEEDLSGAYENIESKDDDIKYYDSESATIEDVREKYNVLSEKLLSDTVISAPVLLALLNETPAAVDYELSRNQMSGQPKTTQTPASASNKAQSEALKKYKAVVKDSAVSKAEAGSNIVKQPEEAKTLILEFWYSPVNFKGYRYSNNTIRLYGIEKGTSRLFVYNNEVYMRHEGKVYLMSVCPGACVFNLEKNTEITNLILRQN